MSDQYGDQRDLSAMPAWAVEELRRPVQLDASRRERIMRAMRRTPVPPRRGQRYGWRIPSRPGWLGNGAAFALAAALMTIAVLGPLRRAVSPVGNSREAVVLPTRLDQTLRDTLRFVRFVLDAPTAAAVAVTGDFLPGAGGRPLMRDAQSGKWVGAIAMRPGHHRYAFVVRDSGQRAGPRWHDDTLPAATVVVAGGDTI